MSEAISGATITELVLLLLYISLNRTLTIPPLDIWPHYYGEEMSIIAALKGGIEADGPWLRRVGAITTVDVTTPNIRLGELYTASVIPHAKDSRHTCTPYSNF